MGWNPTATAALRLLWPQVQKADVVAWVRDRLEAEASHVRDVVAHEQQLLERRGSFMAGAAALSREELLQRLETLYTHVVTTAYEKKQEQQRTADLTHVIETLERNAERELRMAHAEAKAYADSLTGASPRPGSLRPGSGSVGACQTPQEDDLHGFDMSPVAQVRI